MKLVPDWKDAWRWFSVWAMSLSTAAPAAWLAVPEDMREAVPAEWLAVGAVTLGIAGLIGRLVAQK
jgi:hypothetical protein